jgi:membrane protease subunit (stomatin/prohibitin family)
MAAVMEFLEYPERSAEILHRVPGSGQVTLRTGAQCRVGAHQAAVFYRDGAAADVLHAGRHRLSAETLPGLASRTQLSDADDRFRAAVYFVSDRVVPAMTWELAEPLVITDDRDRNVTLTARGTASFRITNAGTFVGMHAVSKHADSTRGVLRNLESNIAREVGAVLARDVTSAENLSSRFNNLATESRLRLKHVLGRQGVELIDFFITAIEPLQRPVTGPATGVTIRRPRLQLGSEGGASPQPPAPSSASVIRKKRKKG